MARPPIRRQLDLRLLWLTARPATPSPPSAVLSPFRTSLALLRRSGSQPQLLPIQSHTRAFHVATLLHGPVDAVESLFLQLHSVSHAPWFVVIPLVALGVNLLVRLPFTWHARGVAQKRARLNPLLHAWVTVHGRAALREQPLGPAAGTAVTAVILKKYRATARRVYHAFGVQQWKLYGNLLALPPWLVVLEALRRLCGAPVGLLGMLWGGADTAAATAAATTDAPPLSGSFLWCPDLTAADPYGILPLALSAMLVANIIPSSDAGRRALFGLPPTAPPGSISVDSVAARALQRTLLLLAFSVGPLTMHFPSALHLYWLSSTATSFALTRAVHHTRPIRNGALRPPAPRNMPWITPRPPS